MAILGTIVPSCVKNDPEFTNNEVRIGFDSPMLYTSANTKVSVFGEYGSFKYGTMDYTYPREEKIKIFAVHHEGLFVDKTWEQHTKAEFNGAVIRYDSGFDAWLPKTDEGDYYYFHGGHKLSYAAMSPADLTHKEAASTSSTTSTTSTSFLIDESYASEVTVSFGNTGLTIENFQVSENPDNHFELLYTEIHENKVPSDKVNNAEYYSGLPIQFKHALSSIHFSLVKSSSITQDIVLTGIKMSNIQCKGSFNQNIQNSVSNPSWTIPVANQLKHSFYPYQAATDQSGAIVGGVSFPPNPQYISSLLTQDETDNKGTSHPLLLIPQTIANSDIEIRIDYTVDGTPTYKVIEFNNLSFSDINGQAVTSWLPGYRYTFRLKYSDETHLNDIIYFSPSTDPWPDSKIIEINL